MNYLCHYGVKGMKWGVRRYQNAGASKRRSKKVSTGSEKQRNGKKTSFIKRGFNFMQQDIIQQQMNQNFINWSMQESTRASINAANQAASLSISGGMNPFMFGMM